MKKKTLTLIIAGAVVLILVFVGAYIFLNQNKSQQNNFRGGQRPPMQLSQQQIDDLTNFFSANPTNDQIQSYCQQNRVNCFYYCRSINPQAAFCSQMMNFTRMRNGTRGNFTRGNFTGNYSGGRYGGMPQ